MDPYDSLFYDSLAIPETHPERLAVLGRLMGLGAAPPDACRVLELGCATGGNLIPMAAGLPGASFLGIDRSAAQIASGNRLIERLGLGNILLREGDILDLDPADRGLAAPFDYIVAHGVYSWIPAKVAERLLELAGRLLAPAGIFYVSYNVLPGWRLRGTLRDCLQDACRDLSEPGERLAAGQAALKRLAAGLAGLPGEAARLLREEIRRVGAAPASYLYFEYLDEHNRPVLFRDLVRDCASHRLRYLCDTRLHTLFPASLGDGVEGALADLEDGLDLEQWLDFLGNRAFRQSLFIRADAPADERIDLDRFAAFAFSADLVPPANARLRDRRAARFARRDGESCEVSHPLGKAVVSLLAGSYPDALTLDAVFPEARRRVLAAGGARLADDLDSALAELFGLFARGYIQAHLHPRQVPLRLPERPRVRGLVRAFVESDRTQVPTRDHANLDLDDSAARLLAVLDGTRTLPELAQFLGADADAGRASSGAGRSRKEWGPGRVGSLAERLLEDCRRYGLLEESEGRGVDAMTGAR